MYLYLLNHEMDPNEVWHKPILGLHMDIFEDV